MRSQLSDRHAPEYIEARSRSCANELITAHGAALVRRRPTTFCWRLGPASAPRSKGACMYSPCLRRGAGRPRPFGCYPAIICRTSWRVWTGSLRANSGLFVCTLTVPGAANRSHDYLCFLSLLPRCLQISLLCRYGPPEPQQERIRSAREYAVLVKEFLRRAEATKAER